MAYLREHVQSCSSATKNISITIMPMTTKRGMVVTYHEELPPYRVNDPLITWSYKITWQIKTISTITASVAIKLGRVVNFLQ